LPVIKNPSYLEQFKPHCSIQARILMVFMPYEAETTRQGKKIHVINLINFAYSP